MALTPPIGEAEAGFITRRAAPPALDAAVRSAFAALGQPPGAVCRAAQGLVDAAEAWAAAGRAEPAYHNRLHVAEATLAMGWLCAQACAAGQIEVGAAFLGVVAMAGHDLCHDGSIPVGTELEERAVAAAAPVLAGAGLPAADIALVDQVILGTALSCVAGNAAALAGPAPSVLDVLRCLANEADVFASMLPRLGPVLGRLLAQEWQDAGHPEPPKVGTHVGRFAFLHAYPPFSAPARAVGLDAARRRGLAAYAAAGGAAALDAMPPDLSAAAYAAALDATSPSG